MKKSNKKIIVITGSRGDYDLLKPIIKKLYKSKKFNVNTTVTGSHLINIYQNESLFKIDSIKINKKIKILYNDDNTSSILNYLGDGIKQFNIFFSKKKPDIILVLGDRYEIFSAVISAFFKRIPVAHISGGEITQGSLDDGVRHSITKMSTVHFVSNKIYASRVAQLGENRKNIFNVGSTGVEDINKIKLLNKIEIQKKLKYNFKSKNFIITFHPVTLEKDYGLSDFKVILKYFSTKPNFGIVFTLPNADTKNYKIINLIKNFVKKNKNATFYSYLGIKNYFSLIKNFDAVIGNSSSGISEVPSFKKATINVGLRQNGRIKALSIIDIKKITLKNLDNALKKIESNKFKKILLNTLNPYYKNNSSNNIVKILEKININEIKPKKFVDLNKKNEQ
jgi:GDP/UDP-N,N'-diacetylbacillosamine 2-epimerase (hydrolysing)